MDILIHTASGMLMGCAVALINPWKRRIGARQMLLQMGLGGLAGAFPDLDAISQWSGFDRTIGAFFNLASGDEIYSGRWWYSHHAFTHSILASVLFAAIIWGILYPWRSKSKDLAQRALHGSLIAFLGWNAHLAGDLPTPKGSWDGIAYWWPSSQYIGGTGHTFWWNNYDIFLIILSGIVLHWIIFAIKRLPQRMCSLASCLTLISLIIYQLHQRPIDFNDRSRPYADREKISLEYQRSMLGETLFQWMQRLDNSLPVYF
jgi:hypothetical protein